MNMNIESTSKGMVWVISLYKMSKPNRINATESKIEKYGDHQMIVSEWNARRVNVSLGRATAKAVQTAYTELLNALLAAGHITPEVAAKHPQFSE